MTSFLSTISCLGSCQYGDLLQVGVGQRPWDHYQKALLGVGRGALKAQRKKYTRIFAFKSWDGNYHHETKPRNHERKD